MKEGNETPLKKELFQDELEFFIKNQGELVDKYKGKVLVLFDGKLWGVFDSIGEADCEAAKKIPIGNYMLQVCRPGKEAYTVIIASNLLKPVHHY